MPDGDTHEPIARCGPALNIEFRSNRIWRFAEKRTSSWQTLVISGATGNIGSSAVSVGLAMGAKRIVALGREARILEQLKTFDPHRVTTVQLRGELEQDKQAVAAATTGGADVVYDMLGNVPSFQSTAAAIHALRRGGTAVLMGGVQAAIELPYSYVMLNEISIRGALMYPRSAPRELINMLIAGTLGFSKMRVQSFSLDEILPALDHAEHSRGPSYTVLHP
jgi:alcohol dehydrogenase